jgi:hypothetical protein
MGDLLGETAEAGAPGVTDELLVNLIVTVRTLGKPDRDHGGRGRAGGHRAPFRDSLLLHPAIYAGDNRRLIVPDLRLGADLVPSQRA